MKNFLCVFLAGVVGFIIGFIIRLEVEADKFIIAVWDDDPVIVVCPDSQITPYRVNRAIDWWRIRGHNVSYYHYDNDNIICNKGLFVPGIIFVRGTGDLPEENYAITTRLALKEDMIAASILIPNRNKHMSRLLEHELGHAFGMTHVEKPGHMMHPIHEYGGEKFWVPD